MIYAVICPVKTWDGTQMVPTLITEEISEAQAYARQTRARLVSKKFHHWAKHIKIICPKTSEGYRKLSDKVLGYAQDLDFASNGNSIYAQSMIDWGNRLRKLAAD